MTLDQNKLAQDLQNLATDAAANQWSATQVQQHLAQVLYNFVSTATVSGVTVALADGTQVTQVGSVNVS
jgi:hypothetical protein